MRKSLLLTVAGALLFVCCSQKEKVYGDFNVIPKPQSVSYSGDSEFNLKKSTKIVYPAGNERLKLSAELLSEYIKLSTGLQLSVADRPEDTNAIILETGFTHENGEAYRLDVDKDKVTVSGASEAGVFYGIQTLRKAVPVIDGGGKAMLPQAVVVDYPRFGYRGVMLDVGRHMFPVEFIKKFIDNLAMHNINRFHWHLTEDQGWRIEIKKYPELTETGSMRKETLVGHGRTSKEYDNTPYGGFYTQEEAREIVKYAADRHITVIPEIDMPGHMLAALASYPELGCTGGPYEVGTRWGVYDEVLCAGNEKVFEFVEGVLSEIMDIFPSETIHIGGDECPKKMWQQCPKCQSRIREEGLKADKAHSAENRLQSYFITRVEKFLNGHGRNIIGWDEILEGGLAPNATVMSWQGVDGGIAASKMGHNAIMTPLQFLYFDYYQTGDKENEPLAIGGNIPVSKVYGYEPLPDTLTENEKKHIIGVQANLWTEYISTGGHAEYMLIPRLDALSELQWTMPELKDYNDFIGRLSRMTKLYDRLGYNYARHALDRPNL